MKKKSEKTIERENLKEWRSAVLKRDNYKCVICGNDKRPHCHHIIPKQFKEIEWDANNGIALCFYHHKVGKFSPHQNAIWFSLWLKKNKEKQYEYLLGRYGANGE